jgi:hypothetical protein
VLVVHEVAAECVLIPGRDRGNDGFHYQSDFVNRLLIKDVCVTSDMQGDP